MPSTALMVTRLDGPDDADTSELQNPLWSDIETAIRRLNGHSCTLVCLGIGSAPVPHMSIGGGANGQYIVYATPDNATFYNLVNPHASVGKCMLKAGGQVGDYELKFCADLADVLQAARTYAETGHADETLLWEKQPSKVRRHR